MKIKSKESEIKSLIVPAPDIMAIGKTLKKEDVDRSIMDFIVSKERVEASKIKLKEVKRLVNQFAYEASYQVL